MALSAVRPDRVQWKTASHQGLPKGPNGSCLGRVGRGPWGSKDQGFWPNTSSPDDPTKREEQKRQVRQIWAKLRLVPCVPEMSDYLGKG